MVSKWMDNGNMLEYVREHHKVDRMRLVSLPGHFVDRVVLIPTLS
jgi:hypothetical protein